ncbi:MAG: hypothetical protein Q9217_002082 [Psora testacea]
MSSQSNTDATAGGLQPQFVSTQTELACVMRGLPPPAHSSHPALPHLTLLVFEAVLEVVCVSLPGYIVARQGMFTAEMQKFTANLNVTLFTPCLIFTKLASQLTADKLVDLAIIPAIFIVQTLLSYLCSLGVSKAFGFSKRPRNFVIAMGVFGNSNSLPISLVLSLSQTINGLHWDKVPGDNDGEVAARGILYLLIFQQLGQLLRWSWGYNVLLAPPDKFDGTDEQVNSRLEDGSAGAQEQYERLIDYSVDSDSEDHYASGSDETRVGTGEADMGTASNSETSTNLQSGEQTPVTHQQILSQQSSRNQSKSAFLNSEPRPELLPTPANGNVKPRISTLRSLRHDSSHDDDEHVHKGIRVLPVRCTLAIRLSFQQTSRAMSNAFTSAFRTVPNSGQRILAVMYAGLKKFCLGVWEFMNPPLWAMLAAIVVASIPDLQHFFFADGTFFKNSVTSAIRQSGGVAVPLILVVLGGNLARNTLPNEQHTKDEDKEETKLLVAALISRMVLPLVIMAPLLAVTAKFVPVSILDDPIFVIVCFLITGAPSALQLAQICQINNVYMGAMSRLLFQSYVVWILPSTLILVMCALEVVEWAQM